MTRLTGFAWASLSALLLTVSQTTAAATVPPLPPISPTFASASAGAGVDNVLVERQGGNTASANADETFSDPDRGHYQATARGQAGGESSLGAPPFAEGLADVNVTSLNPDLPLSATASAGGLFQYQMRFTPIQPAPGGTPVLIYWSFSYAGQAKLSGDVGGASRSMSQIIVSASIGGSILNVGANARPGLLFADYSGVLRGSTGSLFPETYAVFVNAGTLVQLSGSGSVDGEAIADPSFAFDQAAFEADMIARGETPFLLSDYFAITLSEGYYPVPEPERAGLAVLALALLGLYSQRRTAAV